VRAIELLAQGQPKLRVARAISVDRSTLDAWLAEPAFSAAIDARSAALLAELQRYPRRLVSEAFRALRQAMRKGGPAGVRAALAILGNYGLIRPPDRGLAKEISQLDVSFDVIDATPAKAVLLPAPDK
jgi:hypothetical protein